MSADQTRAVADRLGCDAGLVRIADVLANPDTPPGVRERLRIDMGLGPTLRPAHSVGLFQLNRGAYLNRSTD